MKVGIYVRLSKEDEDVRKQISGKQESESIQNQKSLLIQYAVERGYDIYNIYTDEDYSGADRDRPAFSRLIQDASEHKFDIVLAKSQSRFTRDMELVERYLHGKFPEWGIRFIALVDHADTDDANNKKARQINGLINEWYLEDLSINVRTVLTHKCQSGQHIGSFAPYGYAKDPANHNHLVVDPVAAAVVRRIFSMVLSGYGASRIAKTLNEEGIPSPTRYKQQQGLNFVPCHASRVTGLWTIASIRAILTNQTYTGDLVQGRHKKASYKSKKIVTLPKDKWIIVPNTHEPIITREAFEQVQQLRCERAVPCFYSGVIRPLAKKVFCGVCGGSMQLCSNGNHRQYLRCRIHACKPSLCKNRSISASALDEIVLQRIRQRLCDLLDPDKLNLSAFVKEAGERADALQRELDRLRSERQKRQGAVTALYQDHTAGVVNDEIFAQLDDGFRKDIEGFDRRIRALEEERAGTLADPAARYDALRQMAEELSQPQVLTRELVCALIDSVRVGPIDPETQNRAIEIRWRF